MDEAAKEPGGSQVISQLRKNQNIEYIDFQKINFRTNKNDRGETGL
ncbi:hypothetical protein [Bathymodiolus japonicus methanotrophic gill symbiont]|nr:hypothetical protein [Bathymodiolus japonicus methanotrophic gill symbiont]